MDWIGGEGSSVGLMVEVVFVVDEGGREEEVERKRLVSRPIFLSLRKGYRQCGFSWVAFFKRPFFLSLSRCVYM